MTDRDRRSGNERPQWTAGRGRALVIAAGVLLILVVSSSLAFVLGGGLRGTDAAGTPIPATVATASPLPDATHAAAAPSGPDTPDPGATAGPGSPTATTGDSTTPGTPTATQGVSPTGAVKAKRIRIERLGITLPIVEGDGIDAPMNKAAHYPSTGWPGGGTNIYIYGHARKGMFITLWDARKGDEVVLDLVDGTQRTYVVTRVLPKVPWDAVEYLDPTPTEQLTLQTSTSYYPTAPRFIVIAVPQP